MTIDFLSLKHHFFNTAIADIYRAIRGGSLIGAFTQRKLIYVKSYFQGPIGGSLVLTFSILQIPDRFVKMDAALASLDSQTQPQVDSIVDAIRKIYPRTGLPTLANTSC